MKTKTLEKKLALNKKTVSHLEMKKVKGGVPYSLLCPPTFTNFPCDNWTVYECSHYNANCITIQASAPCC